MFFQYPYTDMYALNLDWMIKAIKEVQEIIENLGHVVNTVNGLDGDVTISADMVNATGINSVATLGAGVVFENLTQAQLQALYNNGVRLVMSRNNLGVFDRAFFLTGSYGGSVTAFAYDPTGELSGVVSINGLSGALMVNGANLPISEEDSTTIKTLIDHLDANKLDSVFLAGNTLYKSYDSGTALQIISIDTEATEDSENLIYSGAVVDAVAASKAVIDAKLNPENATPGTFLQIDAEGESVWGAPATDAQVATAVTDWLEDNIPTGTTVVIDRSLSVSDAAADAKVTGDEITDLKSALKNIDDDLYRTYIPDTVYGLHNFSSVGGSLVNTAYAVITENFIKANAGSTIECSDGYQIKAAIYNTDNASGFENYIGWTTDKISINKDCYIRIGISSSTAYGEILTDTSYSQYIEWGLVSVPYITADEVPQFIRSVNLFDAAKVEVGSIRTNNGSINPANTNYRSSAFIPVTAGLNYIGNFTNHLAWYDSSKTIIGTVTNLVYSAIAPSGAAYARIDFNTNIISINSVMFIQGTELPENYIAYWEQNFVTPLSKISGLSYSILQPWVGKNVLFYGDSITAQTNGDQPTAWSTYVYTALALSSVHGRGVGGQTFFWNTNTFQVDADGNYVNRGTEEDNCLGCFSSWQRISSMIPDTIKNTIDAIVIMGGTNDIGHVEEETGEGAIEWVKPVWSPENTTDTHWVNAAEYNGGDYSVATFTGAIASTIMKMQARCPNAKIIIASPISRWNMSNHIPYEKNGVTMQDMVDIEHKTAKYMSVPFIDVNELCGINIGNYTMYIYDGVHPNAAGHKMLASAMLSGFEGLYPKIS